MIKKDKKLRDSITRKPHLNTMNVEKHISLIWLVAQAIDINRKKERIIREKLEIEN